MQYFKCANCEELQEVVKSVVEAAVAAVVLARRSELNSIVKRNTETVHIGDEVKITFFIYISHLFLCISALVESGADMKMVYLIVQNVYV